MQPKSSGPGVQHLQQLQVDTSRTDSGRTSPAPSLLTSRRASSSSLDAFETPTEATQRSLPAAQAGSQPHVVPPQTQASRATASTTPSLCIVSGGSAANSLVGAFLRLSEQQLHVLPVSDNGGSSSEIIRCFGGPSIGDIRSRLIRLIPGTDKAAEAIKRLLSYRLSTGRSSAEVRAEWHAVVEGRHDLWYDIPADRREVLRSFLVLFEAQILSRAHRHYNMRGASIGNLFLSGCLQQFRNLESSIFLFATLTRIPEPQLVLPCIATNSIVTIAADLENGQRIVGQSAISRPPPASAAEVFPIFEGTAGLFLGDDDQLGHADRQPHASLDLIVDKEQDTPLDSRIKRIIYLNNFGMHVFPKANPRFIHALHERNILIYSAGSLFTSIMPCLALRGVGQAIARSEALKCKVLLLNSLADRETPRGFTAKDFILAITSGINQNREVDELEYQPRQLMTHCIYVQGSQVEVNVDELSALGVEAIEVPLSGSETKPLLGEQQVYEALEAIWQQRTGP